MEDLTAPTKEQSADFYHARVRVISALHTVIANLKALMASDSIMDVSQLVKITSELFAYPEMPGVSQLSKQIFSLVFNPNEKVQTSVVECF